MTLHVEAPLSCNFRMYRYGETFQFTVREEDPATFFDSITNVITAAQAIGWEFAPAQQPARPVTQQQVVPTTGQAQPAQPAQQAQPSQSGSTLRQTDIIDGYVLGSYLSKRTNVLEPCAYLYTTRRPFKAYTVYPEQFSTLLPNENLSVSDVSQSWQGSPPSKEQAIARGVYHKTHGLTIPITPMLDTAGQPIMKNGYVDYRPLKNSELGASPLPVTTPAQPAPVAPVASEDVPFMQHVSKAAPFAGWPNITPNTNPYAANALAYTMQDTDDALSGLNLDDEAALFFGNFRTHVLGHLDVTEKKITDVQWALLNTWCAEQVGMEPGETVDIANVGHVPLAGVLGGLLCDRWAERPNELPGVFAVAILSRVMPTRGGNEPNPNYDAQMAGAISMLLRTEYKRLVNGEATIPLAF